MKKILSLFRILAVTAAIIPTGAWAADTSDGCGAGWHVTSGMTLSATSTRSTTAGTLPPTFSMTSGTSGCAKHPIAKKDQAAFEYAVVNYDSLTVEMAQGRGEGLAAFARTLGCSDGAVAKFGQMTQRQYSTIVTDGAVNPFDFFSRVQGQVQSDPALSVACHS